MSEIQWGKTSFDLRFREYNNYFDLEGVDAYNNGMLRIVKLYKSREAAVNEDMFSVLKKLLVECDNNESILAYLDDEGIMCIEFANGNVIKHEHHSFNDESSPSNED